MQRRRFYQTVAVLCSDLGITAVALLASWWLRFAYQVRPVMPGDILQLPDYLFLLPFILPLWALVFAAFGLYRVRRTAARAEEYVQVAIATTSAMALFAAGAFLARPTDFSRLMFAMFYALDVIGIIAGRAVIHAIMDRIRRSGRNLKRVLIAGTGELARAVIDKMRMHQEFGFRITGMLGDENDSSYHGVPVVGRLADACEFIRRFSVDQIYIALPLSAYEDILRLLDDVSNEIVEIKVVPDLLQHITLRAAVEDFEGVPIVNLSATPMRGLAGTAKRALDIGAALACIVLFAPIFPLVALAIRLTSAGPVLYRQERMGLDGRSFELLKFRSMVVDAEKVSGPVWTEEADPRITPVGRFLRKFSLDELPQFFNVLRGDMSMVGPRPERPYFVQEFRGRIPRYMLRHRVRAGMTGWAQVNGWRGNTSLERRIQYDLYYIENWSLTLDFKIIWLTITNGLGHEHAY
jgi:Undecaprenyl-phosphate glucose phosphotransferase